MRAIKAARATPSLANIEKCNLTFGSSVHKTDADNSEIKQYRTAFNKFQFGLTSKMPHICKLNEQAWNQGSTILSPSHRYINLVSNTTRDTTFCITNKTASFCAEFSYFLSLWSQILFLGTILSKAQYTTMAPGVHLILTSLWIEKRFCNRLWVACYNTIVTELGKAYSHANGVSNHCGGPLLFGQTSHNHAGTRHSLFTVTVFVRNSKTLVVHGWHVAI